MLSRKLFHAVDSHTEGMPTRVITGGVGVLPGATMAERRLRFMAEQDELGAGDVVEVADDGLADGRGDVPTTAIGAEGGDPASGKEYFAEDERPTVP